jgi:hypothetical protein
MDEYDLVQSKSVEPEPDPTFRLLKTMAKITSNDNESHLSFRKNRLGSVQVNFKGHHYTGGYDEERCDMGHTHLVPRESKWAWLCNELTKDQAHALGRWLLGIED